MTVASEPKFDGFAAMVGCAELRSEVLFDGRYAAIPLDIQSRIMAYLTDGTDPGSFLEGVFTNDLRKTVNYSREGAPYESWYVHLQLLVWWVYNQCPLQYVGDGYRAHVKK